MNEQEKLEIERLSTPENKRKLNALLNIYSVFRRVISLCLEDIKKIPENLDVIYARKLVPKIQELTNELQLGPGSNSLFKLPPYYIPFQSLAGAGKAIRKNSWNTDVAREEIYGVYDQLKTLANGEIRAYEQEPIPAVQVIINEAQELLNAIENANHVHPSAPGIVPKIFQEKGWWCISMPGKQQRPVQLFKKSFWAGEFLGILGDPWGAPRKRESVFEILEKKTKEMPTETQIDNVMREINRKLKEKKIPSMALMRQDGDMWLLVFKTKT
jgi:hypothetical protein